MFSPHLFTHKYDIDDLILALCAEKTQWLETRTGTLSPTEPTHIPASHRFQIEPLPAAFLAELAAHDELKYLTQAEQQALQTLLKTATVQQLGTHLAAPTRGGGWLRERVKEAALEWLDAHDLIPPSMRHINRKKAQRLARSITIEPAE